MPPGGPVGTPPLPAPYPAPPGASPAPTQRFEGPPQAPVGPGGYPIGSRASTPYGKPESGSGPLPAIIGIIVVVATLLIWRVLQAEEPVSSPSPTASSSVSTTSPTATPTPTPSPTPTPTPTPSSTPTPTPTPSPTRSDSDPNLPTVPGATTQVRIESVVLCSRVDAKGAPIDPVNDYTPRDTFYASMVAHGLRVGSKITVVWFGPGIEKTAHVVSDKYGAYYVWFSQSPDGAWEAGTYKLYVLADGVLQKTQSFEVRSDSGSIDEATTCRRVDESYKPVDPTTSFGPRDTFNCSVRVTNLSVGQIVETRWYQGSRELKKMDMTLKSSGAGYLAFSLEPPSGADWEAGDDYRVDVYLDGRFSKKAEFAVEM